jgi:hypothetical protein
MTQYRNTRIVNNHRVEDFIDIMSGPPGEVALASHRVGNVLRCDLILNRGAEDKLAILITDLAKRGFLDLVKLGVEIELRVEGPPIIDNHHTPCEHTWEEFADHHKRCTNCGQFQEDL